MASQPNIVKGASVTEAEAYLRRLCEQTFLSLWSYPNPQSDEGLIGGRVREVCDLLVVCGSDVIIFSDKGTRFPHAVDLPLAWSRWFRKAIYGAAKQAWGAQRLLSSQPARIFLDRACKQPLPVEFPRTSLRFHLIVVAHGVSEHVRQHFGDSGTLMIDTMLRGAEAHTLPFCVGDLAPEKQFVHVLDDESLIALMSSRDTVVDFLAYLEKREALLRGATFIAAAGEEELLAYYLTHMNAAMEHDFAFEMKGQPPPDSLHLDQGFWESFQASPERARQLQADEISYIWDKLIDSFGNHDLNGTQYTVSQGGFADTERVLRFMARAPRVARREYSLQLVDMLETTPVTHRRIRVSRPLVPGQPHYVFLLFPHPPNVPYAEYREVRGHYLGWCCLVARLKYPEAEDIVGIATEPGIKRETRSEDAVYFDGRVWTEEHEREALSLQEDLRILTTVREFRSTTLEYPE